MKYYLSQLRHYPVSTLWTLTKYSLIVLIVGSLISGGIPPSDLTRLQGNGSSVADSSEQEGLVEEGYNLNRTEALFIQYLNEERSSRGLQNVTRRAELTTMGRSHSKNMAENDYFDHTEPDGDTIEDRYRQRGLLPECKLPISGSNRYYSGAENIAQLDVDTRLRVNWADGGYYSVYDEEELARAIFEIWMHSKPHKKAMLVASADEAGLGIYITEGEEAYASLELC